MKVIDKFVNMSIDEFAEWIDNWGMFEDSPWINWWDKNYCSKCMEKYDGEVEFPMCEFTNKCEFFEDMECIPRTKDMVKMWLESECE